MANYFPPFSLRISEALIEKIKFIASENKRSANKEMEFALEKYVKDYEKLNGQINSFENMGHDDNKYDFG